MTLLLEELVEFIIIIIIIIITVSSYISLETFTRICNAQSQDTAVNVMSAHPPPQQSTLKFDLRCSVPCDGMSRQRTVVTRRSV